MKHGIRPEDVPPEPHITEARRLADGQLPLLSAKTDAPPAIEAPRAQVADDT